MVEPAMRCGPMIRFALILALASSAGVASAQETLRVEHGPPTFRPASPGEPRIGICRATALSRMEGERAVWTRPLPERARAAIGGVCECTRSDGAPCAAEVRDYLASPSAGLPPGVIGLAEIGGRVVLADRSGLLLLDARSGEVVVDDPRASEDMTFFDDATWELGACRGTARGGVIFGRCGAELVVFDGAGGRLLSHRPLRIVARGRPVMGPAPGPAQLAFEVPLGRRVLRVRGAIYLH